MNLHGKTNLRYTVLHTPLHVADETGLCDLDARGFSVTVHATMFLTVWESRNSRFIRPTVAEISIK